MAFEPSVTNYEPVASCKIGPKVLQKVLSRTAYSGFIHFQNIFNKLLKFTTVTGKHFSFDCHVLSQLYSQVIQQQILFCCKCF